MSELPKWELSHIGIFVTDTEIENATHRRIGNDPTTRPFAEWRDEKRREFGLSN